MRFRDSRRSDENKQHCVVWALFLFKSESWQNHCTSISMDRHSPRDENRFVLQIWQSTCPWKRSPSFGDLHFIVDIFFSCKMAKKIVCQTVISCLVPLHCRTSQECHYTKQFKPCIRTWICCKFVNLYVAGGFDTPKHCFNYMSWLPRTRILVVASFNGEICN